MTLNIDTTLRSRRKYLQIKLWDKRIQLIRAYEANSQIRVNKAKLSLARILRELAESPELGPKRPFSWGNLEVVYKGGFDQTICWPMCEATNSDMYKVACLLEWSVFSDQP